MQRYNLVDGVMKEDPKGQWVNYGDSHCRTERLIRMALCWYHSCNPDFIDHIVYEVIKLD